MLLMPTTMVMLAMILLVMLIRWLRLVLTKRYTNISLVQRIRRTKPSTKKVVNRQGDVS